MVAIIIWQLYWFFTVSWYPDCYDMRGDIWRLVTVQLTHSGLMHIMGNTVTSVLYGVYVETFQGLIDY